MTYVRSPEQKARAAARRRTRDAAMTPEAKAKRAAVERVRRATPEGAAKQAAANRAYRATPGAKATAAARQRARLAVPGAKEKQAATLRANNLKRKFGITVEQYDLMLAAQGGRCAICRCMPRTRMLAVDHCHKTKAIRGLLCSRCNHSLLGAAHDKVAILERAVAYMKNPPAPAALLAEEGH